MGFWVEQIRRAFPFCGATLGFGHGFAVGNAVDGAFLEFHDVLRERAGFVGEDVFDLAKVVGDVPCFGDTGCIERFVVHIEVLRDEECLDGLDDFDGNIERDGYDVLEGDET